MENKQFLDAYTLINQSLAGLEMDRTFNSIGSNVFFEFGKEREVVHRNGKKQIEKDWSIWIGNASWRISQGSKYIVGSGDSTEIIQSSIQKLLGKRFKSLHFLSQFLDPEFSFEEDYRITTFFNWLEEDQWTVFLPNETNISVDADTHESIKNVQNIARDFQIVENYERLDTPIQGTSLIGITYNENKLPVFHFEENLDLSLDSCAWRLEKDGNYVLGCLDDNAEKIEQALSHIVGKTLEQIDIANPMLDARFQFNGGFVLKTFSCCHTSQQWTIYEKKKPLFSPEISLI